MANGGPRLFILNTGSTSTKVAIYQGNSLVTQETLFHSPQDLAGFSTIWGQYDFRKNAILDWFAAKEANWGDFSAIVSRGGVFKPIPSGVYLISEKMLEDAKSGKYGQHACNVGCLIAFDLGSANKIASFTVDPPCADEMIPEATYTGLPQFRRWSWYQALNQKATGRKLADRLGVPYDEMCTVIAHLGGGTSVAAHEKGKVIDVNNGLDGDGPFSPERVGTLPAGDLVRLCFSGAYTQQEIKNMICGRGGLVAHLGTTDANAIEKRIADGDTTARAVYNAMLYQVAKAIGAAAVSLQGRVQAIAVTGGLANSNYVTGYLERLTGWIAPFFIFPGENEMESLAQGALRCLRGEEEPKAY